jgi:large conductance mechanosensitive channel
VLKGFKDFLLRGNVVDLAVAVVIGGAFTAQVAGFGSAIINPIIAVFGGDDAQGVGFELVSGNEATFVDLGAVLTAIISFLITAAVVYFAFIVPMNAYQQRRKAKLDAEPEPEEIPADVALLAEIRDLLATGQQTSDSPDR